MNDPALFFELVPGVGIEPTDSCFKGRQHYQQRRPRNVYSHQRVPCGSRTHLASLEGWNLCRSAKGTYSGRRGSRTLKAHRSTVFETAAIAHWLALPQSCGGRNRTCVSTINSRLPVPAQDPPHQLVRTAGFEPAISCSRGTRNAKLSHVLKKCAQPESNRHTLHGKQEGCHYIMGANYC